MSLGPKLELDCRLQNNTNLGLGSSLVTYHERKLAADKLVNLFCSKNTIELTSLVYKTSRNILQDAYELISSTDLNGEIARSKYLTDETMKIITLGYTQENVDKLFQTLIIWNRKGRNSSIISELARNAIYFHGHNYVTNILIGALVRVQLFYSGGGAVDRAASTIMSVELNPTQLVLDDAKENIIGSITALTGELADSTHRQNSTTAFKFIFDKTLDVELRKELVAAVEAME